VSALERQCAAVTNGTVAYADQGEGPVALFVHGVFLNADLWRNVVRPLSAERRCVAVDIPGHGGTRLDDGADLSLSAQADLLEELCDRLGLGPIDLVGNDTGGAICQVWAVRHPERLRSLTLTNCDCHDNLPPPGFASVVQLAAMGQLAPIVQAMAADLSLARGEAGYGGSYEDVSALPEEILRGYVEPLAADGGVGLERWLTSVKADDLVAIEPDLRRLTVPTLVAWGTGDSLFDRSWASWLRDTMPGVRDVVEIDGCKLFFPDERADELVDHLRRFWSSI
jgi:pimeloyl-ACP methyl ester carboxylesterase